VSDSRYQIMQCYKNHNKMRSFENPSMTKRRLLYLKTQFVPRCKHYSSRIKTNLLMTYNIIITVCTDSHTKHMHIIIIIIIIIIIMSELILTYLARQNTKDSILRSTVQLADIQKIHAPTQFTPQPSVFVFSANGKSLCVSFREQF
jgi:hypothetical protein